MIRNRYLIVLLFASSCAMAQNNIENETLLGAGVRSRPKYDGSDRQTTELVPVVRYFNRVLFARTTQGILEGGARLTIAQGLAAGLQLAHEHGPQDREPGASLGAHLEWVTKLGPVPLSALARLRHHTDSERGQELDARVTAGVYGSGGVIVGIFGQASWANEKHMLAYYDIRASGLLHTSIGALGSYELSRHWLAVAKVEFRRLADDPARSPLVQDRTGSHISLGVAYRF
jgi:outer membrane scaffolding protein for murein synthesis (MipA/OmpV family)